ncbi:MAG: hypothetical protein GXO92_00945 [FCB group bacterium]|nr:hypothetical protein [FCB group bacterium]
MTLGRWLNSLTFLDHIIILGFFVIAGLLAHVTLIAIREWYLHVQRDNPYAHEFRITPLYFMGVAILYTVIIYKLLGGIVTTWVETIIGK